MEEGQELILRLTRESLSRPWGFRLQGGVDIGYPLTIQRVFSGSPAEGILQRGDAILRIENYETTNLLHKEAQDLLRIAGTQLGLFVRRPYKSVPSVWPSSDRQGPVTSVLQKQQQNRMPGQRIGFGRTGGGTMGDFGVQYGPKKFVPNDSYNPMEPSQREKPVNASDDISGGDQEEVDYSFMTLPVSERKKLFISADRPQQQQQQQQQQQHFYSLPRQRSQSYRAFQLTTKPIASTHTQFPGVKPPDFGWAPSAEKMRQARLTSVSSLSVGQMQESYMPSLTAGGGRRSPSPPITRQFGSTLRSAPATHTSRSTIHQPQFTTSLHVGGEVNGGRNIPIRRYSTSATPTVWSSCDQQPEASPNIVTDTGYYKWTPLVHASSGVQPLKINVQLPHNDDRRGTGADNDWTRFCRSSSVAPTSPGRRDFHPAYPAFPAGSHHPQQQFFQQSSAVMNQASPSPRSNYRSEDIDWGRSRVYRILPEDTSPRSRRTAGGGSLVVSGPTTTFTTVVPLNTHYRQPSHHQVRPAAQVNTASRVIRAPVSRPAIVSSYAGLKGTVSPRKVPVASRGNVEDQVGVSEF